VTNKDETSPCGPSPQGNTHWVCACPHQLEGTGSALLLLCVKVMVAVLLGAWHCRWKWGMGRHHASKGIEEKSVKWGNEMRWGNWCQHDTQTWHLASCAGTNLRSISCCYNDNPEATHQKSEGRWRIRTGMNDLAHPARARLTFVPWMTLMMIMAPLIQGTLSANDLRRQA